MKSSKLFRRIVITVVMLPIAFLLIAWLVNLSFFDEDLNPDVASILQPVQRPPHEGNAYFAAWGISATADKDMIESGVRLVERYHDNGAKSGLDTLTPDDFVDILGAADLDEAWLSDYSCTARTSYGCLANARRNLQKGSVTSSRSQLMLARHQQILQMQFFKNWGRSSFTSPIPPYWTVLKLSQLKLASLSDSNLQSEFLQQLQLDMQFWKMMLVQGSELIDKMFGIAGIWTDVQFLSEYLTTHDLSGDDLRLARSLLAPLTANELNLADAFIFEQRTLYLSLDKDGHSLSDFGPLVSPWLIQVNATSNSYYKHVIEPVVYLSGLTGAEFFEQTPMREQRNRSKSNAHGRDAVDAMTTVWPGTLYNLGGKVLLSKLLGYPADYIARVHDLNSMISLVGLQLSMQVAEIDTGADILKEVASAGSGMNTLLAGKGLSFDPADGWLQFDCLYERSFCKIKLDAGGVD